MGGVALAFPATIIAFFVFGALIGGNLIDSGVKINVLSGDGKEEPLSKEAQLKAALSRSGDESAKVGVEKDGNGKWKVFNVRSVDAQSRPIAWGNFNNSQIKVGWTQLHIKTNDNFSDSDQAVAAGVAEGYLMAKFIVAHYKEFITLDMCKDSHDGCEWIRERIRDNTNYVKKQIRANEDDKYWHQVNLIYRQMEGIKLGLQMKMDKLKRNSENLNENDAVTLKDSEALLNDNVEDVSVIMMNLMADIWDLMDIYKTSHSKPNGNEGSPTKKTDQIRPTCSVLIKYFPDKKDVILAHNSWYQYRAMAYRVLKKYELGYSGGNSESRLPGHTISMSSYAGFIASLDDFYVISSGLAATETTLDVYDKKILNVTESIFEPFRVMIANRLSTSGNEWARNFQRLNSGTYNNQWMVVDFNKLKSGNDEGLFTVSEQMPGIVQVSDQSHLLMDRGFWPSYNRAFYPGIRERSGAQDIMDKFPETSWFTYDKTPRSLIFHRDQHKVKDVDSMMALMRYNDFENDPAAKVEGCSPPQTPSGAIACRLELTPQGQNCSFNAYDAMIGEISGLGAIDAKVLSGDSFEDFGFTAVAGPTWGSQTGGAGDFEPFQWTKWKNLKMPYFAPIDKFDFEPFRVTWRNM